MTCTIGELLKYNNIDVECPEYISNFKLDWDVEEYPKPNHESNENENIYIFNSDGKLVDPDPEEDEYVKLTHRLTIGKDGSGSWVEFMQIGDEPGHVDGTGWTENGEEMEMIS